MTRTEFENLIKQLSRKLYSFAFRILRDQEEAEDAVQEIFIRLWRMGQKLEEYKSIEALATAMTRNHCIDVIRRQKHNYKGDFSLIENHGPDAPSPQEIMENRESGEILNMIIARLPEIYRIVLRLRDIEGASYLEISLQTKQNINTLRVTLSRARKIVRDEYNKYQYERSRFKKAYRKVL